MLFSFILVVFLSCVHIFANRISILNELPRRNWLSLAGGISVAFIFLHILPELQQLQGSLADENLLPYFFENEIYAISMAGILLFYGIEQMIIHLQEETSEKKIRDHVIFWSHIGVFALFNSFIGYYLHNEMKVEGLSSFLTFVALGFHFLINDYSLLRHHDTMYHNTGRWVMSAAVIAGWGIGASFTIPDIVLSLLFAIIAGAIVVNSFKEELPEEKESNFLFFLFGAVLYTLLLVL